MTATVPIFFKVPRIWPVLYFYTDDLTRTPRSRYSMAVGPDELTAMQNFLKQNPQADSVCVTSRLYPNN